MNLIAWVFHMVQADMICLLPSDSYARRGVFVACCKNEDILQPITTGMPALFMVNGARFSTMVSV